MKKKILFLTIACLAIFFTGRHCNAQTTEASAPAAVKKTIAETNALYFSLFSKRDNAIVNLYTEDACLFAPYAAAIYGRAALAKDFKDTYAAGKIRGVKFATQQVYGNGNEYVTEEGTWQVYDIKDNVIDNGKYLKLWKKTTAGWKIFRDVFNSNPR